jgi:hypothetical protein
LEVEVLLQTRMKQGGTSMPACCHSSKVFFVVAVEGLERGLQFARAG